MLIKDKVHTSVHIDQSAQVQRSWGAWVRVRERRGTRCAAVRIRDVPGRRCGCWGSPEQVLGRRSGAGQRDSSETQRTSIDQKVQSQKYNHVRHADVPAPSDSSEPLLSTAGGVDCADGEQVRVGGVRIPPRSGDRQVREGGRRGHEESRAGTVTTELFDNPVELVSVCSIVLIILIK
ncbi:hypothetical protein NQD34_003085 [Periophthalmus magnuspinnatus]|nr:hypothetical protein NQD34_003085 [Periophthalmus magnuspinnatus]